MAGRDIESIENGIKNVEKRLHRDVANMCVILQPLAEKIFGNSPGLPRQDTDLLREHFHDIYKSLRLHLVFHSGADLSRVDAKPQLQDLGRSIGLNPEELERRPDENSALDYCADPWSKLLEIVSRHFRMVGIKFSLSTDFTGSSLYNGNSPIPTTGMRIL